jgi:Phosphotransferase enzyme family
LLNCECESRRYGVVTHGTMGLMSDSPLRPVVRLEDLSAWCVKWLAAPAADSLFETGVLSAAGGLRLDDGRAVVVKVRPPSPRLASCFAVQRHLWQAGFTCPEPLVGPQPLGDHVATAEALLAVTGTPSAGAEFVRASAAGLARLVSLAPRPGSVPSLAPSPGYAGWDHDQDGLWPTPTDGGPDYNACPEPEWADRVAAAVRERLRAYRRPPLIGHGDWWDGNLVWDGCDLLAVPDWDSVICQPAPAIAGFAAAEFLGLGGPQGHATVEQSATFLDAYAQARGLLWDTADREVAWAAGVWVRAFDAKEATQRGDPDAVLAEPEARARLELSGLNPNLVKV